MGTVWRDPPTKYTPWQKRLSPLLDRPGEWALVATTNTPEQAYSMATSLRTGKFKVPKAIWEFSSHGTDEGTGEVFAKCLESKNEPLSEAAA